MDRRALKKLKEHILTLHLKKSRHDINPIIINKNIPANKQFSIQSWRFECGMPACVSGHAQTLFPKKRFKNIFGDYTYEDFAKEFILRYGEAEYICHPHSYKTKNPSPQEAAQHIQDVLDGKCRQ